MPSPRPVQMDFTAGEITPLLYGRQTADKYLSGAAELLNLVVHAHGGLSKRPGSIYIANTKSDGAARLISFEFKTTQAYILELGNLYARIYRDRAQVISGTPVEIVTPWSTAELDDLQFAQSSDTLYIVHPSHKPRTITRTSHTAWTIANYAPTADPFTSANNYPSVVTFFQQRLVMGGTNTDPSKFWATRAGDFNDMTQGALAGDGYNYKITSGSGRVPVLQWMAGSNDLLIGTASAEVRATGGNYSAITPTNIDVREQTSNGSAKRQPIIIGNSAIFVQRSLRKLMSATFSWDRYEAGNVSVLSQHVTRGGISHLAFKPQPDSAVYSFRADGKMLGMTYDAEQQVIAWHRHQFGADGVCESVASIPYSGGDELWAIVRYTINGSTARHVVVLDTEDWRDSAMDTSAEIKAAMVDCFYVDSGVTYDGAAATTISGLSHLIGESVAILADGIPVPSQVVNGSGEITLTTAASKVHVGLPYSCKLKTLPLATGAGKGDAPPFGAYVGWIEPRVLLHLSGEVTIAGERIQVRATNELLDDPTPLFSGYADVPALGYDALGQIVIEQSDPLPVTILAIGGRIDVVSG